MLPAIPWKNCFSCVPYLLCYYQILPLLSLSPTTSICCESRGFSALICSHCHPISLWPFELCDEFASQLSSYPGWPLSHKPCHKPCKCTTSPCNLKEPPGAMHTVKDPGTHFRAVHSIFPSSLCSLVFYRNKTVLPSTINYSLSLSIYTLFFKAFVPHVLMSPLYWKNTMKSLLFQMPGNLAFVSVPRGLQEGTEFAAIGAHVSRQFRTSSSTDYPRSLLQTTSTLCTQRLVLKCG